MPWGRKKSGVVIKTLVGADTRVEGDVVFSGGCHVDGYVRGDVICVVDDDRPNEGLLSISEGGTVEGNVSVPHLMLNGTVKGDVRATERVELGAGARVIGNVQYNLIEMAIGAEVNGKLVHESEGVEPSVEEEPAAPMERVAAMKVAGEPT